MRLMANEYGVSFHMMPHRNWFYEHEELNGSDVILGYDSLAKCWASKMVSFLDKIPLFQYYILP